MAISELTCATAFLGNASTVTAYPINWRFIEPAHVKVRVRDVTDPETPGEWQELSQPGDYQALLWDDEILEVGYNPRVLTTDPWPATTQVFVYRETPILQPIVFPRSGVFPAESNELGHDRSIMILQEFVRDYLAAGGSVEVLFGNPFWKESQGEPWVMGKPFEEVSIGGNGVPDQGKAAVFDSLGGISLTSGTLTGIKRIGFHSDIFRAVSETRDLGPDDNGMVLYYTGATAITLTAPSTLPDGFSCKIKQQGSGQITIAAVDLTLRHPDTHSRSRTQWSQIYVERQGANIELSGDTSA